MENNSNQLLNFLTAATSNLQEALSKPSNGKKVNHRKYLQKRLQKRDPKATKKTKSLPPTAAPASVASSTIRHQPVATMPPSMYWPPVSNSRQFYQPTPQPPVCTSPPLQSSSSSSPSSSSLGYSQPPSCPGQSSPYDPEFESLLNEIGLDSPSRYSDSPQGPLSRQPSLNTVHWETYLHSDYIPSPPSDFSDVEDSAYSSPCNPSPVYYPGVQCLSPPTCYQHHMATTASCEWLPSSTTCGPSTTVLPPSLLNITPTLAPSLNELLELVTP